MSSTFPSSTDFLVMMAQKKPSAFQQKPAATASASAEVSKKPARPQIQAIPLVYQGPIDNSVCFISHNH